MIGPRIGLSAGVMGGVAAGIGADHIAPTGPMSSVFKDATSGKYMPQTLAQWNTALSVAGITKGGPSLLWLLQQPSGNATDVISGITGTLTGSVTFGAAISGWSTPGITFADGGGTYFTTTSASLPDVSTTSVKVLAYAAISTPSTLRQFLQVGTTTTARLLVDTSSRLNVKESTTTSVGTANLTGAVRPYVLKHNVTGALARGYSDQEKLSPAFSSAVTGQELLFPSGAAAPMTALMVVAFFGAAAETTDAEDKTLLQTLNWSPAWT